MSTVYEILTCGDPTCGCHDIAYYSPGARPDNNTANDTANDTANGCGDELAALAALERAIDEAVEEMQTRKAEARTAARVKAQRDTLIGTQIARLVHLDALIEEAGDVVYAVQGDNALQHLTSDPDAADDLAALGAQFRANRRAVKRLIRAFEPTN